jgi:DNA-repair protein XRCC2
VPAETPVPPIFTRGQVVEVQSSPGFATSFLYFIVARCLLENIRHTETQPSVAVFDTGPTFDIARFRNILVAHLAITGCTSNLESAVEDAMSRLHVFQPTSSLHLALALTALPGYLASHSADSELAMIAIDSISDFYWPDRYTMEQNETLRSRQDASLPVIHPVRHTLLALERLRRAYSPSVIITNWGLNHTSPGLLFRQHMRPYLPDFAERHETADQSRSATGTAAPRTAGAQAVPLFVNHHITLVPPRIIPASAGSLLDDRSFRERQTTRPITGVIRHASDSMDETFDLYVTENVIVRKLQGIQS